MLQIHATGTDTTQRWRILTLSFHVNGVREPGFRRRNACRLGIVLCRVDVHRLVGLVVNSSAPRAEDPGFDSRLRWDFSGVESYQ